MIVKHQAPNYYPHCDGGGCGTNACDGIAGQYGPGLWFASKNVVYMYVVEGLGLMFAILDK